ncbi:hypothetical protein GALMADRAFT_215778 [Galerina marginata CBS 339.88]|uniref:GH10 domain-containing protein n=1 Tax=Galerina marginata (strain CBS 339.88) TaxID=685588 RepID=A0A067SPE1_GALM3|nr:hypothetical protein GALMADRAFT_215778 [Galerina marginata CBS 339.88]
MSSMSRSNDDGTWHSNIFYGTIEESYVGIALRAARAADLHTNRYINDTTSKGQDLCPTAMLNLVKSKACRWTLTPIEQFTFLGVEVALTDLDIRMNFPVTDVQFLQQKRDYQAVISGCKNVPGCVGVTVWGFSDWVCDFPL